MVAALSFAPAVAFAEGRAERGSGPATYLFHLIYDNSALSVDAKRRFSYDLLGEQFVQETLDLEKAYRGKIINMKNEVVSMFYFDPKEGKPADFSKGDIEVKAPYFADALKVDFYDSGKNLVLTVPVKATSFCDDDGVCEADIGENARNCPYDCRQTPAPPSAELPTASPAPNGAASRPSRIGVILAGTGMVVCLAMLWILKRKS